MSDSDNRDSFADPQVPPSPADYRGSTTATPSGRSDEEVQPSFKSVGYGRRWYDPVYNLLRFFQYSWLGRRLPASWRRRFYYMSNYLVQVNEVQRMIAVGGRVWDEPLNLPEEEHVSIPGIWIVDYFPPSLIDELDKAIRANHWDNRPHLGMGQSSAEALKDSRQGSGPSWWRIADISTPGAGFSFPDGYQEKLPKEFRAVELKGVPIGEGLTAVVAYFHLSKRGAASVDEVWHAEHRPALAKTKGRLVVAEGEKWTAFRQTQAARDKLHAAARKWMSQHCPGAFVKSKEHQPAMDLLLLDRFDPSTGERSDRQTDDWMRALGLTESQVTWRTSGELPGLLLEQSRQGLAPGIKERTWALWGNRNASSAQGVDLRGYGADPIFALANFVDGRMGDFVVRLGLSELLEMLRAESAMMRDSARSHHGKFGRRDLKRLRQRFLTASLDYSSIERDVKQYNDRRWRDREAWFVLDYPPWLRKQDAEAGRKPFKPIQINKELRKQQNKAARDLVAFDRSYREILATVASLGASIDAYKVQRYAIWIAIGSAIVALVTLWISLLTPGEAAGVIQEWRAWIAW